MKWKMVSFNNSLKSLDRYILVKIVGGQNDKILNLRYSIQETKEE